jgi:DNA replication and repair protein RecF
LRIAELRAQGWRNLAPLVLAPSPRMTVLSGDNGQGKTNVIEAIYYLARLRSFRTAHALDLIQRGPVPAGRAQLVAAVERGEVARRIEIDLEPAGRTARLDGKLVRGAAAVLGAFSVVLFVPEDLLLPRAAPAARRRYLDLAVFNVEGAYYKEAAAFQKILRSRNLLLRQGRPDPVLLDTYDEELARTGARVVMRRRALVAELAPRAAALFQALHGELAMELCYRGHPEVDGQADERAVRAALHAGLAGRRATDERRRFTGFGPHMDDLEIRLEGHPARQHASQGQLRSLVLALKLAELTNAEARAGDVPVLLLDDVPSELDPTRRRFLFEMVGGLSCQTIITVTERDLVPLVAGRADYHVAQGRLAALPLRD